MSDNDYSNSIAVAYPALPAELHYDIELPKDLHVTIMYLGEIPDVSFTSDDVLRAARGTLWTFYQKVNVVSKEMFGSQGDVPVLRVEGELLHDLHNLLSHDLATVGIFSASAYPDYKPHITVTKEAWDEPFRQAILAPAELWWGNERISL